MAYCATIIGGGLAGSEAALQLARRGIDVVLYEQRPTVMTPVHSSGNFAELVCSNSLKSLKPESAAGLLKEELVKLGSVLITEAYAHRVSAGGALAVDREAFSEGVTRMIEHHPRIRVVRREVQTLDDIISESDVLILASGPLTDDGLAATLASLTGSDALYFYDAAAPIVMADSLDYSKVFVQNRYEEEDGDYLNAPFTKDEYDRFIDALVQANRVILRDFETQELFQACQPIEELARKGHDAPRFGPLKPVGLLDPRTGKRPWAALQLRAENAQATSYNLVGFQTNLTFAEQKRVFSMVPGLEHAEFARFGVMHRNTFIDAPRFLEWTGRFTDPYHVLSMPVYVVGQLAGTEGYCEAIRSGLHGAFSVVAELFHKKLPRLPEETVFGSLMAYATNLHTVNYQPMHVNFGIMKPLDAPVRNKRERYRAYAQRANNALKTYYCSLKEAGFYDIQGAA